MGLGVHTRKRIKRKKPGAAAMALVVLLAMAVVVICLGAASRWMTAEEPAEIPAAAEASLNIPVSQAQEPEIFVSGQETLETQYDDGETEILSVSVSVSTEDGYSHTEVTLETASSGNRRCTIYWAHSETGRLQEYDPIYSGMCGGDGRFTLTLNDGLYMPDEADGIEIVLSAKSSCTVFAAVPELLKLPESEYLYSFHVLSDMHINPDYPEYGENLSLALADVLAAENDSIAIFTCGDSTDNGNPWEYDRLMEIVEAAGEELPAVYYAIGNHDLFSDFDRRRKPSSQRSSTAYDEQVALFLEKTGMSGSYYSVESNGARFIVLESKNLFEEETAAEQLVWLETELTAAEEDAPIFLFLHEPLMDTVSGSLYSMDSEIQTWYGSYETVEKLREILAQYPNAILFTGHTHWKLESIQPVLLGYGEDASFVNCAATSYLWTDSDEEAEGSQGYLVEVYEDYILLRGREFTGGNWCAAAQIMIPIAK